LAASPANNTSFFCMTARKCDVLTPTPALNMSVASRTKSNETWMFVLKIETSPKAIFLIHKPPTGKTAAMA
jgi:hypothetical protein